MTPSDTRPPIPGLTIHMTAWGQSIVTAICANDDCPWKYRGIHETETVDAAEDHALASGHGVDVHRSDRRYVAPAAGGHGRQPDG